MHKRIPLCASAIVLLLFLTGCSDEPDVPVDVGPQEVPLPPVGYSWSVQNETAVWTSPPGIQGIFELISGDYPFFIGVVATQETQFDLLLALAVDGTQDLCSRTVGMQKLTVGASGEFSFGPENFTIANGITAENMELSGQFSDDFKQITNLGMVANIDLETIPADIFPVAEDSHACDLLELAEINCNACSDGRIACIQATVTSVQAVFLDALKLIKVDVPDCHPSCPARSENPDC